MSFLAEITDAGIAKAEIAEAGHFQIAITDASFSSNLLSPAIPDLQAVTAMTNITYTAPTSQVGYHVINANEIMFRVNLPPNTGPFNFGSYSLNLADGTPFAVGTWDTLQTKDINSARYVELTIEISNAVATINLTIINTIDASLPEVPTEDNLPPAIEAPYSVYYVHQYTLYQNQPALASRLDSTWYFYPALQPYYAADIGAVNTLVANPVPAFTNLAQIKTALYIRVAHNNTIAGVTLNVNGIGAKTIINLDGTLLIPEQIVVNSIIAVVYDPVLDNFQLLTPQPHPKQSYYAVDISTTVNELVANPVPAFTDLTQINQALYIRVANTNNYGGALNINGLGFKQIVNLNGYWLRPGQIIANSIIPVIYDPVNDNFQILTLNYYPSRIVLLAPLNLYVSTTGNDNFDGLTPETAFQHLQTAWDYIITILDLNDHVVVVHVADGTYLEGVNCFGSPLGYGTHGGVAFIGNVATPANCVINVAVGVAFNVTNGAFITIRGFTLMGGGPLEDYSTHGTGLAIGQAGVCVFDNCAFGVCTYAHISIVNGGVGSSGGNPYSIVGGAPSHVAMGAGGALSTADTALTITGMPHFSQSFLTITEGASANVWNMTFNGNTNGIGLATGLHYSCQSGGTVNTLAAGESYLPGDTIGYAGTGYYE